MLFTNLLGQEALVNLPTATAQVRTREGDDQDFQSNFKNYTTQPPRGQYCEGIFDKGNNKGIFAPLILWLYLI